MARSHGRVLTSIWSPGGDFTDLTEAEQRLYLLALSQSSLTYCGVLPYTLRRWEGLGRDSTVTRLRRAVKGLQTRLYVLTDEDTEEMWLRTFVKNDGILTNPNVARAAVKDFPGICSLMIRGAFLAELHRLSADATLGLGVADNKGWQALGELLHEPLPDHYPDHLDKVSPEWCQYARAAPSPLSTSFPTACPHGHENGPASCALCRSENRTLAGSPR